MQGAENEERRQRRKIDEENERAWRIKTLRPEAAAFWVDILDQAEPIARHAPRTSVCDYAPWTTALRQIASGHAYWTDEPVYEMRLMAFAKCVARADWPSEHDHLIEFTLKFLEADVMKFSSGYTKKLLLKRLKHAAFDGVQLKRVHALLKRAVTDGTGLEEYREFCRLAARVMTDDLHEWLEKTAAGVLVAIDDRYGPGSFYWYEKLGDEIFKKYGTLLYGRAWVLVEVEPPHSLVKIDDVPEHNDVKLNAWRMLMHIKRTET